jgi:hypothetical protein
MRTSWSVGPDLRAALAWSLGRRYAPTAARYRPSSMAKTQDASQ